MVSIEVGFASFTYQINLIFSFKKMENILKQIVNNTHTQRDLLKYPDDFSKAQGINQLWYKDTSTTAVKADNNGFSARHAYLILSPTVLLEFQ